MLSEKDQHEFLGKKPPLYSKKTIDNLMINF